MFQCHADRVEEFSAAARGKRASDSPEGGVDRAKRGTDENRLSQTPVSAGLRRAVQT
jgi:hypothetical protein